MNFDTQYRKPKRFITDSGSTIRIVYSSRYKEDGTLEVYASGTESLTDFIQSHADSVNIHTLLRLYRNGDQTVLNKRAGFYGDISKMPTSFADILNLVNDGQNEFNSLSPEVRAKFDHDFGKYLASYGSSEFYSKLGVNTELAHNVSPDLNQTAEVPKEEVSK